MSHPNSSGGERRKAKRLAKQLGITYQQALDRMRAGEPPQQHQRVPRADEVDLHELAAEWLEGQRGRQLRELVQQAINGNTSVKMDEFTPWDLVEGTIEEALLETFRADREAEVDIEDVHSDAGRYGVHVNVAGEGDVDWHVSAPTGGDVEAFGDDIEGYEDGGGMLQQWDSAVPVVLSVYATFDAETEEWTAAEVSYAAMPKDEVERRDRRHSDEEFSRLQALGLEPSDDEIQAMADAAEQRSAEHGDATGWSTQT